LSKLLLATSNSGKLEELRALLADLVVDLVTPNALGLDLAVDETGHGYAENASLKARAYAAASGLPALADDSGLEVDALGGAPGLHSARFAPQPSATDADRRAHLLWALAGKAQPWTARFISTICLACEAPKEGAANGKFPAGFTRLRNSTHSSQKVSVRAGSAPRSAAQAASAMTASS